jgi:hypothetical protein
MKILKRHGDFPNARSAGLAKTREKGVLVVALIPPTRKAKKFEL